MLGRKPEHEIETLCFSPHLCVGFLFLILYPSRPPPPPPPPPPPQLCHTPSFTHNFVTHHLSHTALSHTLFHITLSHTMFHTQLCPTHTHTHHLSHIFHTSFTHNFVTYHLTHITLSHTIFHTTLSHTLSFTHNFVTHHLSHTTLSHTIFHTPSWRHLPALCLAARGTYDTGLAPVARLVTFVLRGRRGTSRHHRRFVWQAWHLACDRPSFCVACLAMFDGNFWQNILACLQRRLVRAMLSVICKPCLIHVFWHEGLTFWHVTTFWHFYRAMRRCVALCYCKPCSSHVLQQQPFWHVLLFGMFDRLCARFSGMFYTEMLGGSHASLCVLASHV